MTRGGKEIMWFVLLTERSSISYYPDSDSIVMNRNKVTRERGSDRKKNNNAFPLHVTCCMPGKEATFCVIGKLFTENKFYNSLRTPVCIL